MSDIDKVYRAHVIYMNLNTGQELHECSGRPYSTPGPATRAKNKMKRKFGLRRNTIRNPNYKPGMGNYYMIEDPNDTRTDDELLPFYRSFVEVATEWQEV